MPVPFSPSVEHIDVDDPDLPHEIVQPVTDEDLNATGHDASETLKPGFGVGRQPHPTVSIVTGPIGVGKSAVLCAIESLTQYDTSVHVYAENTAQWQYYLERFYEDPHRYAFFLQKEVESHFHAVTRAIEQLPASHCAYVERSPLDALHVFLPLNRANLSELRHAHRAPHALYDALQLCLERYAEHWVWREAARYTLLTCDVATCEQRIAQRARPGEERIDTAYTRQLHTLYAAFATRCHAETGERVLRHCTVLDTQAHSAQHVANVLLGREPHM